VNIDSHRFISRWKEGRKVQTAFSTNFGIDGNRFWHVKERGSIMKLFCCENETREEGVGWNDER